MPFQEKPYLIDVTLHREKISSFQKYPFSLPIVKHLHTLTFHPDVTFFVGENGSGKSTLIEAIASLLDYNPEGGNKNIRFSSKQTHSNLHQYLKLSRSFKKPKDGFFLRAESFYNVASYVDEIGYLETYGGKSLHEQSHGEAFIALITNKFRGNGLYILDEPEAALSPTRQMTALALMHELVKAKSQFIIATHSPILMAYPRAKIYWLSETGIEETDYKKTEHYEITKTFLNQPERMLHSLFA